MITYGWDFLFTPLAKTSAGVKQNPGESIKFAPNYIEDNNGVRTSRFTELTGGENNFRGYINEYRVNSERGNALSIMNDYANLQYRPGPSTKGQASVKDRKVNPHYPSSYGIEFDKASKDSVGIDKDSIYDTRIESLIEWSAKYPQARLYARDFAYLADLGRYPNNRLVVLRRYPNPIGHDILGYPIENDATIETGPEPISTIITWMPPVDGGGSDKLPVNVSFNEIWEDFDENLWHVLRGIMNDIGVGGAMGSIQKLIHNNPFTKTLKAEVMRALGITTLDVTNFYGNPNFISRGMARRNAKAGEQDKTGLEADISFELKTCYRINYQAGLDPSMVYHDILANIIRMGTSPEVYQFTGQFGGVIHDVLNKLSNGQIVKVAEAMIKAFVKVIKQLFDFVVSGIGKAAQSIGKAFSSPEGASQFRNDTGQLLEGLARTYFKGVLEENRNRIMAAVATSTGAPTGMWHLTIGNPRNPIVSIGNMIVEKVKIEFGNELGFNDLPTHIYATISLKNGAPMGSSGLETIFNGGTNRIYYSGLVRKGESVKVVKYNAENGTAEGYEDKVYGTGNDGFERTIEYDFTQLVDSRQDGVALKKTILSGKVNLDDINNRNSAAQNKLNDISQTGNNQIQNSIDNLNQQESRAAEIAKNQNLNNTNRTSPTGTTSPVQGG